MKQAVLLLAHGAPERVEDVPAYLANIRAGRPVSPQLTEEIQHRYAAIGGSSPLLKHTRAQAEALELQLGVPVYFGMRNWHPFIRETLQRIDADRIVAICLAPQYSDLSVGLYMRRTEEAKREVGLTAEIAWTRSFHDHPKLIAAFAKKLTPLVNGQKVIFTAHSLPEKILSGGDPYDAEAHNTARLVAERLGLADWEFAYQSQGATDDKWLSPTVESRIDQAASGGVKSLVIDPIGFVCDHVEILYDIDIGFREYAEQRGITVQRPESLNDSPPFIETLAAVAAESLR